MTQNYLKLQIVMFSYDNHFQSHLDGLKDRGNYRTFLNHSRTTKHLPVSTVEFESGRQNILVWCSNDYLGMSQNAEVIAAAQEAIAKYGCGSGGTRNISGTHPEIVELEEEIAAWVNKPAALVFSSGYVANQSTLAALLQHIPGCTVISDQLNHDSIVQGIRLSQAKKIVFKHNCPRALEQALASLPLEAPKLLVFESVYSMEGDFGPIREFVRLAKKYNALTFIDETHAVGLYGTEGGGVVQSLGLSSEVDFIQGGLGKGVGVVGGFIAGSTAAIDFIRSTARGFIFTTSLPPANCAAARASIKHIRQSSKERSIVHFLAKSLRQELDRRGIVYIGEGAHIVPVVIGEAKKCTRICNNLLQKHKLYLQPINHPTVPLGTERMRITPTALHCFEHISELALALSQELFYNVLPRKKAVAGLANSIVSSTKEANDLQEA